MFPMTYTTTWQQTPPSGPRLPIPWWCLALATDRRTFVVNCFSQWSKMCFPLLLLHEVNSSQESPSMGFMILIPNLSLCTLIQLAEGVYRMMGKQQNGRMNTWACFLHLGCEMILIMISHSVYWNDNYHISWHCTKHIGAFALTRPGPNIRE